MRINLTKCTEMAQHSLSNVSTAAVRVLRKLHLLGKLKTKRLSKEKQET